MAIYNTSILENVTNVVQLMDGLNSVMPHTFFIGNLILIAFFIVTLIYFTRDDFAETLVYSGILATGLGLLLYAIQWVGVASIIIPFILMCVSLAFLLMGKR